MISLTTFRSRTAAVVALALAAACAAPSPQSLSDGRTVTPTPTPAPAPTTAPSPTTEDGGGGIKLPVDGAESPVPGETSLMPSSALVGGIAPTVTLTGSNFVARTVLQLDGTPLATSFVSTTALSATLPQAALSVSGMHAITAFTSAPGGGRSSPATFAVLNPIATLSEISPNAALSSAGNTMLTVTGTNFVAGSTVNFGGTSLATSVTSATSLSAEIASGSLTMAGSVPITVTNPSPGGGESTSISFTVANPTVTVTATSPTSAIVGASAVTLTVTGTGFVSGSLVSFNGTMVPTTVVSGTSLTATVAATSLATTGSFPIIVTNPAPGGGVSLPVTFTVGNPDPAITSLVPATAIAGAPPTAVTVNGTGFVSATQITIGGAPSATTFVSSTQATVTLTAAQLMNSGTISIAAVNPTPGGGTSSRSVFTVDNPTPVLTSISPSSVVAGSGDTTVTAFGSSFVSGAQITASGAPLQTTYVSASELRATLRGASLASATSIPIAVVNPAPGSSTSSPQTLTVTAPPPPPSEDAGTVDGGPPPAGDDAGGSSSSGSSSGGSSSGSSSGGSSSGSGSGSGSGGSSSGSGSGSSSGGMTCDSTGVNATLSATGATQTVPLTYSFGPVNRFYYDPSLSSAYTCPVAELDTATTNYAAVVVQNTSGTTAYLEANADCASTDVAFLAVYANTTTVPTSNADRAACTGFVANGTSGGGALTSSNAAGSQWCPGVTKANGGSITLPPCATAVVLVQGYDPTQFTTPGQMDLDLTQ